MTLSFYDFIDDYTLALNHEPVTAESSSFNGGVFNLQETSATIQDSIFFQLRGAGYGGSIYTYKSPYTFEEVNFIANNLKIIDSQAMTDAGAIYTENVNV